MVTYLFTWSLLFLVSHTSSAASGFKPNIVLIIADDMGWSDTGFTNKHGTTSVTPDTPNLNRLAEESIVLDNFYTQTFCTPTRSSLFTGRYPHRLGYLFSTNVVNRLDDYLKLEHTTFTEVCRNA